MYAAQLSEIKFSRSIMCMWETLNIFSTTYFKNASNVQATDKKGVADDR